MGFLLETHISTWKNKQLFFSLYRSEYFISRQTEMFMCYTKEHFTVLQVGPMKMTQGRFLIADIWKIYRQFLILGENVTHIFSTMSSPSPQRRRIENQLKTHNHDCDLEQNQRRELPLDNQCNETLGHEVLM